ncbi:MAG: threonine synthase [Bacteroidales bacterium]|nr:threonine synthase [Bacteroidales bacterium]
MNWYSTNGKAPLATLKKSVIKGLAEDRGLYMPCELKRLPAEFFAEMDKMSFQEIAFTAASAFFGEDVPAEDLRRIVNETLSFDCPIVPVEDGICSLELFHGPTLAFKDVGARFMARLLQYFTCGESRRLNVLVATSGDTGSAVANGFLGVEGIHVYVLYPKSKVSPIQECQFTTLGKNITALEIDGVFDDCQALVKNAFMDAELNEKMRLTSANSINVARFLPQSFYYFWGYAQMKRMGLADNLVVCVPSGNFGNICSALFAAKMGLPIQRFIAANNRNDVFYNYLQTGRYEPKASVQTLANAMDVGDPSNFARVYELYGKDYEAIRRSISGAVVSDGTIRRTIRDCYRQTGYLLDPHGACGYRALKDSLQPGETGFFCETAHPAKFKDTVDCILAEEAGLPSSGRIGASAEVADGKVVIPARLAAFMQGKAEKTPLSKHYEEFKNYLIQQR